MQGDACEEGLLVWMWGDMSCEGSLLSLYHLLKKIITVTWIKATRSAYLNSIYLFQMNVMFSLVLQ